MDDQRGFRQVFGAGVPDGEFPLDDELCPDLSNSDGCLDEAIDPHDLGVLGERLAAAYLAEHPDGGDFQVRYDVVSILVVNGDRALLRHHRNALGTL